jgi:hypothetical protein
MNAIYFQIYSSSVLAAPLLNGHLYLDPGSGSLIIQVVIATLLGLGFLIKSYWKKIINFFQRSSEREQGTEETSKDLE